MNKQPSILYVIGNGFDRYHGLQTSYQSFGLFLKDRYSEIYDLFIEYYGLPDLDPADPDSRWDPLWADFENMLANFDYETILDDNTDSLPDYGSEGFRERDYHTFDQELSGKVKLLTGGLAEAMKDFILSVNFPEMNNGRLINFEGNYVALTFNYTNTLLHYYYLNISNILHIHGNASNPDDKLILGHGIDPDKFREEEKRPPDNLNTEELQRWEEQQSDDGDYAFESVKISLMSYFPESYKSTRQIIEKNCSFFEVLKNIKKIYVLGHSLSDVDGPYFMKIAQSIDISTVQWVVSYYGDSERISHPQKLANFNVPVHLITFISMEELIISAPELF